MDFSLNSSVVLAAIVGLWLIWVAPYLLRNRQPLTVHGSASIPRPGITSGDAGFQRSVMTMSAADELQPSSAPATAGHAGTGSPRKADQAPKLKIRWGRLTLAAVGTVSLAAALVTSVLAVTGLVPSIVPVAALLLAVASVAVLRTLAVRGRRRRVERQAPAAVQTSASPTVAPAPAVQRPTRLFNAEETGGSAAKEENANNDAGTPEAAPVQFTAAELRAAALAVAAESGEKPAGTGAPWQPVDVPKPTYVEAPKADREDPAPLDLPEAPKPQVKTPIKNGAAAPAVETPSAPRMNLDDILQRRRA